MPVCEFGLLIIRAFKVGFCLSFFIENAAVCFRQSLRLKIVASVNSFALF